MYILDTTPDVSWENEMFRFEFDSESAVQKNAEDPPSSRVKSDFGNNTSGTVNSLYSDSEGTGTGPPGRRGLRNIQDVNWPSGPAGFAGSRPP